MSWEDIVKVGRPDVPIEEAGPGDMEEYERRMLRDEKYGSPFPGADKMTDEESIRYGRAHDMGNIVTLILTMMDNLDKEILYDEGVKLPEETKQDVRKLVRKYASAMVKQAEDDMDRWKTHSHWKGIL